jgi:hypothetical protein
MKKNPLLLLLICFCLFLSACGDDDDSPSREEMLMNKQWVVSAFTITTPLTIIDYYNTFQACQKDNFVEFRSGGVLYIDEGATKCNLSTPQNAQGTWALNGDILRVSGVAALGVPVNELDLTIEDISSTKITGEFTQTVSGFQVTGKVSLSTK